MNMIIDGIIHAVKLLVQGDKDILNIIFLTLQVSGTATLISVAVGIPLGTLMALKDFRGKNILSSLVNFGMGLPPVVAGLLVTLILWRYGPLGSMNLMYTIPAMIIAQSLVAIPIITGLSFAAILNVNPKLKYQLLSLGAEPFQVCLILIKEAKLGLMAAVIAGFGRVISEVGASMMVGGNVRGKTRILTTAIVLEVDKGNYDIAIAIAIILLLITYLVVVILTFLQHNERSNW
jgi:tungstate transport system permease protein